MVSGKRRKSFARAAFRTRSEHEPAEAAEYAGQLQLRQHAVDAVKVFTDVLEKEDRVVERRQVRRSHDSGQNREIAAEQSSSSDAGGDGLHAVLGLRQRVAFRERGRILHDDRLTTEEDALDVFERPRIPAAQPVRAVEGHEPRLRVDPEKERRDVAVTDDHLWIPGDGLEVEVRQQPAAAPAAADRHDHPNRIVGEEFVDVGGPVLVDSRQIPVTREHVAPHLDDEAERLERLAGDGDIDRLERRVCRSDDPDAIAGRQAPRPNGGRLPAGLILPGRNSDPGSWKGGQRPHESSSIHDFPDCATLSS